MIQAEIARWGWERADGSDKDGDGGWERERRSAGSWEIRRRQVRMMNEDEGMKSLTGRKVERRANMFPAEFFLRGGGVVK